MESLCGFFYHADPARDLCNDPDNRRLRARDPGVENVLVGFRLKQSASCHVGASDCKSLALQEQDALWRSPLAGDLHNARGDMLVFLHLETVDPGNVLARKIRFQPHGDHGRPAGGSRALAFIRRCEYPCKDPRQKGRNSDSFKI